MLNESHIFLKLHDEGFELLLHRAIVDIRDEDTAFKHSCSSAHTPGLFFSSEEIEKDYLKFASSNCNIYIHIF